MFGILGIRAKLLIFGALSWVIIFGVYGTYSYMEKVAQMKRLSIMTASMLSNQIISDREYYASSVIESSLESMVRGTGSHEAVEKALPFHATFKGQSRRELTGGDPYFVKLVSSHPINQTKVPKDAFQIEALNAMTSEDSHAFYRFEDHNDNFSIRYMVPYFATSRSCISCHNSHPASTKRDYKLGDVMGALEVIVPVEAEMKRVMGDVWQSIGYGFIVILGMGLAGLAFLSKVVTSRILTLSETTRHLALGDLTKEAEVESSDEIGGLADGTNEVVRNLHDMIMSIRSTSDEAVEIAASVREMSRHVVEGSYTQASTLDTVTTGMEKINSSITDIAKGARALAASTGSGSTSIKNIESDVHEVASSIETLHKESNETARATQEMNSSMIDVSKKVEGLSSSINLTSSNMAEIKTGIKGISSSITETSIIAANVNKNARLGSIAVSKTIDSIDKTKDITEETTEVIRTLSERVMEIGKILELIRGLSEETNLLALNAAIIATRAGEAGKGFSVVAGEITEIAERAGSSAKEVSKIIEGVTTESRRALKAMESGLESVEESSALAEEAGSVITQVTMSAQESSEKMSQLTRYASELSESSGLTATRSEQLSDSATGLVNIIREETRRSGLINNSSISIKEISLKITESIKEQVLANKSITLTMEDINRMVAHINTAIHEQSQGSSRILNSTESVREVSIKNIDKARETEEAVEALAKLNKTLMESVRRFKLKGA